MTVNVFESGVEMQYQVNGVLRDVDNPQNSMDFAVTAYLEHPFSQWFEDERVPPLEMVIRDGPNPDSNNIQGESHVFFRAFAGLGMVDIHKRVYLKSEGGRAGMIIAMAEMNDMEPCRHVPAQFKGNDWNMEAGMELLSERSTEPGRASITYRFNLIIEESMMKELAAWLVVSEHT